MANFDAGTWNVVFLPKGTPAPIVRSSTPRLSEALDTPDDRERLLDIGSTFRRRTRGRPDYAAKFVESEIKKYEGPIKAAGIVIE